MGNFISEAWDGITAAPMGVKLAMGGAVAVAGFLGYRQYKNNQSQGVSQGQGLPVVSGDAGTMTTAGAPSSGGWLQGGGGGTSIIGGTTPPQPGGIGGSSGNPFPIPPVAPPVGPIQPSGVSVGANQAIYQGVIPSRIARPLGGKNGMG